MRSCRIITGAKGSGKTSVMEDLAEEEKEPQGFVSVNVGTGYVLVNLATGEEQLLLAEKGFFPDQTGCWSYDQRLFGQANEVLAGLSSGTVFIDEAGRLELSGGGFAPGIKALQDKDVDLVIAVRDAFVDEVIEAFSLDSCPLTVSEVIPAEEDES